MNHSEQQASRAQGAREDKRRPKNVFLYTALWIGVGGCVVFALFELLSRA